MTQRQGPSAVLVRMGTVSAGAVLQGIANHISLNLFHYNENTFILKKKLTNKNHSKK